MANYYVRSGAGGSANGSSWANAYTTLAAALAARSAGDTFWLADDHAETQASAMTVTSPGTAANPCLILCVNTHTVEPPTGLATTATVSTTGANSITCGGFAYVYGVTFSAGTGGTFAHLQFTASAATGWNFNSCALTLGNTASGSRIICAAAYPVVLILSNTTLGFSHASQALRPVNARVIWMDTASALTGTTPTSLIDLPNSAAGLVEVSGVDLSSLGSGKSLVAAGSLPQQTVVVFRNCKLGASVAVLSGTIGNPGGAEVFVDNCDSGDTNTRFEHYKFQGSIVQETTKVRTSGASDGTTPIAHKMVTLASGPTLFSPLAGPWLLIWGDTTGSAKTATVEILHDSATALKDSEVWVEVESLSTSGYPQSVWGRDQVANALATPADQASSSATWTTTGLSNPNRQKLEVTFTPRSKGPIRARVCVAKANYTVYVDPLVTVS